MATKIYNQAELPIDPSNVIPKSWAEEQLDGLNTLINEEITTLSSELQDEIDRSTGASQANSDKIDTINSKINDDVITTLEYTSSEVGVSSVTTTKNLYTGTEAGKTEALPIANNVRAGIVLPDLFNTVNDHTGRIGNLEANTSVEITDQPTKADLDNFTLPGNAKAGDTAVVRSDETQGNASTRYKLDSNLNWVFNLRYGAPTPQASQTTLGTVKGNTTEGTVAIETDGSMSVNGYDSLKNSIPTALGQLTNNVGYITAAEVNIPDASQSTKGIATLGATGGAARFGQKADVGLSKVNDTTDMEKPVSTLQQAALDKISTAIPSPSATVPLMDGAASVGSSTNYARADHRHPSDSGKVSSVSTTNAVYVTGSTGDDTTIPFSSTATANSIPRRDTSGNLAVPTTVTGNNAIGASQVDSKVTAAVTGLAPDSTVVHKSGAETVAGIKTFSSIPVLPASNPTSDNQAVRKAYADTKVSKVSSASTFARVYAISSDGTARMYPISSSDTTNETLMLRNGTTGFSAVPANVTGNNAIGASQVDSKISTAGANKVDKSAYANVVYATGDTAGVGNNIPYSVEAIANYIPRRSGSGNVAVPASVTGNNAIGASQVDSKITSAAANKVDKITSSGTFPKLYGVGTDGSQTTYPLSSSDVSNGTLMLRNATTGFSAVPATVTGNNAIGATQVNNERVRKYNLPIPSTTGTFVYALGEIASGIGRTTVSGTLRIERGGANPLALLVEIVAASAGTTTQKAKVRYVYSVPSGATAPAMTVVTFTYNSRNYMGISMTQLGLYNSITFDGAYTGSFNSGGPTSWSVLNSTAVSGITVISEEDDIDAKIANKVDELNVPDVVYATRESGNTYGIRYGVLPMDSYIVQRQESGNITVPDNVPSQTSHAVGMMQVEQMIAESTGTQYVTWTSFDANMYLYYSIINNTLFIKGRANVDNGIIQEIQIPRNRTMATSGSSIPAILGIDKSSGLSQIIVGDISPTGSDRRGIQFTSVTPTPQSQLFLDFSVMLNPLI